MGVPRAVVAADAQLAPGSRATAGPARGRPGGAGRAAPASGAGAVGERRGDAPVVVGRWLGSYQFHHRVLRSSHRREALLGLAGAGVLLRLDDLARPARLRVRDPR